MPELGADMMNAGLPTIFELMARAMNDARAVGKESRNTEQNYNFRGIDAVVNAASPIFRKHGIIPAPELLKASYRDVTTSRGKPSREVTVEVAYHFYGPRGDRITATVPGESMDFGDKGTAKAMSVAFRIALLQLLALPTDDPDPDSFSPERAYRDEAQPAPARPVVTTEQLAAFDEFAKRIAGSESEEGLKKIWVELVAAGKANGITEDHGSALRAALGDRKAEIDREASA